LKNEIQLNFSVEAKSAKRIRILVRIIKLFYGRSTFREVVSSALVLYFQPIHLLGAPLG
jgi:hypothetical protein